MLHPLDSLGRRLAKDFVLVGVPVVVVVATVIMAWVSASGCRENPNQQAYEIAKAINIYEIMTKTELQSIDQLVPGVMQDVPLDPWRHPYQFQRPGRRNPDSFDVVSAGPDGRFSTSDDLGNWVSKRWSLFGR